MSVVLGTTLQPDNEPLAEVAALLAHRMGVPLRLVHVCEEPAARRGGGSEHDALEHRRASASAEAERLRALTGADVQPHVQPHGGPGGVVDELVRLAEGAALLLVGAGSSESGRPLAPTTERLSRRSVAPVLALRAPQRLAAWLGGHATLRVLVGADLGRAARAARAFAVRLSGLGACELEIATVVSPPDVHARMGLPPPPHDAALAPAAETAILQRLAREAPPGERGAVFRTIVEPGPIAGRLVDRAREGDFDLIVVGQRRHSMLDQLWHGSVAHEVSRDATVGVACVPPVAESSWSSGPPRVVVVGTDFREVGDRALAHALGLVASGGVVHLAHVVTSVASVAQSAAARARAELARMSSRDAAGRGVTLERHVLEGAPAAELLALAERTAAELVVVGVRSRPAITRALLGSVAQELVDQVTVPVLLVPVARM